MRRLAELYRLAEVRTGRDLHADLDVIMDQAEQGDNRYEHELIRLRHDVLELGAAGDVPHALDITPGSDAWKQRHADHGSDGQMTSGYSVWDFDKDGSYTGKETDPTRLTAFIRREAHVNLDVAISQPGESERHLAHMNKGDGRKTDPHHNRGMERIMKNVDDLYKMAVSK